MQPPQTQVIIPVWLSLPMNVRLHLKKVFGIPRSEGTNVVDGHVVSDGHTHPDLARITIPAMQEYLASDETDFHTLFALTVDKVEAELAPAPANTEVGKHIPADALDTAATPILLSVGGRVFAATEVKDNAPLYPTAPSPIQAPVKKTRAPRKTK